MGIYYTLNLSNKAESRMWASHLFKPFKSILKPEVQKEVFNFIDELLYFIEDYFSSDELVPHIIMGMMLGVKQLYEKNKSKQIEAKAFCRFFFGLGIIYSKFFSEKDVYNKDFLSFLLLSEKRLSLVGIKNHHEFKTLLALDKVKDKSTFIEIILSEQGYRYFNPLLRLKKDRYIKSTLLPKLFIGKTPHYLYSEFITSPGYKLPIIQLFLEHQGIEENYSRRINIPLDKIKDKKIKIGLAKFANLQGFINRFLKKISLSRTMAYNDLKCLIKSFIDSIHDIEAQALKITNYELNYKLADVLDCYDQYINPSMKYSSLILYDVCNPLKGLNKTFDEFLKDLFSMNSPGYKTNQQGFWHRKYKPKQEIDDGFIPLSSPH